MNLSCPSGAGIRNADHFLNNCDSSGVNIRVRIETYDPSGVKCVYNEKCLMNLRPRRGRMFIENKLQFYYLHRVKCFQRSD